MPKENLKSVPAQNEDYDSDLDTKPKVKAENQSPVPMVIEPAIESTLQKPTPAAAGPTSEATRQEIINHLSSHKIKENTENPIAEFGKMNLSAFETPIDDRKEASKKGTKRPKDNNSNQDQESTPRKRPCNSP